MVFLSTKGKAEPSRTRDSSRLRGVERTLVHTRQDVRRVVIGRVGDGLEVVAYADDGTPEAVEDRQRRFTMGVLWHPEEGEDMRLFEALVEEAKEYREGCE
jgi:gamma-glutamyl-gamma-aminobutyrate hydrolase PuuD